MLSIRDNFRCKDKLKVKGWAKKFHENSDKKGAGMGILISDKIDFKTKKRHESKKGIIY